ncbi:MAG: hypothetical protein ABI286_11355 [Edaphobacter sp.]
MTTWRGDEDEDVFCEAEHGVMFSGRCTKLIEVLSDWFTEFVAQVETKRGVEMVLHASFHFD